MMRYGVLMVFIVSVVTSVAVAQDPPRVFVTGVEGPIARRAIVAALVPMELRECQHTHMGRPVRFTLTIAPDGSAAIDRRVRAHEEVRTYVPCIRRHVSRLRFASRATATRARITIAFQPSGLGVGR